MFDYNKFDEVIKNHKGPENKLAGKFLTMIRRHNLKDDPNLPTEILKRIKTFDFIATLYSLLCNRIYKYRKRIVEFEDVLIEGETWWMLDYAEETIKGKFDEPQHNKLIAIAIAQPKNIFLKEYFKKYG